MLRRIGEHAAGILSLAYATEGIGRIAYSHITRDPSILNGTGFSKLEELAYSCGLPNGPKYELVFLLSSGVVIGAVAAKYIFNLKNHWSKRKK